MFLSIYIKEVQTMDYQKEYKKKNREDPANKEKEKAYFKNIGTHIKITLTRK